jgi:hypothetical protein
VDSIVEGADGEVGTIKDVFFSSDSWHVRYLVVDTGRWLPGRRVVLAPHAIDRTDWPSQSVFVLQTRKQIEDSPSVLEHEPVSRQKEAELAKHYQWPIYWGETEPLGPDPVVRMPPVEAESEPSQSTNTDQATSSQTIDSDLRSAKEVIGNHVEATDGEIGYVQDFIVDDDFWTIRYLVIDTHRWLPYGSVLVSPDWATEVSWDQKKVRVDLTREQVKNSPEFNPYEPVNREYEEHLYNYYGRPAYWHEST